MARLTIDQKSILELLSDKKNRGYLIPDYQRPYAWGEDECATLWEDLVNFAIPNDNPEDFNPEDEYYLGPIVTFTNKEGLSEVIDGQQRLTTILLLLRAFYSHFQEAKDQKSESTKTDIKKCIWRTDFYDEPIEGELKIDSRVADDEDREVFLNILKTGETEDTASLYAKNYRYFQKTIGEYVAGRSSYATDLPKRIMQCVILLPIEADTQNNALRIFSTLNNRGKPLSDSDIFKSEFYGFYSERGNDAKSDFIQRWRDLGEICANAFGESVSSPLDEVFTQYMYHLRAKDKIRSTTIQGLRNFFEKDQYAALKNNHALDELTTLAKFWEAVSRQSSDAFSESVLRRLFVLNYAPNRMWTYFVSAYYLNQYADNGDSDKHAVRVLDQNEFADLLNQLTLLIWLNAIRGRSVAALRAPIFKAMVSIAINDKPSFSLKEYTYEQALAAFTNYGFSNRRTMTKPMLVWWALQREGQSVPDLGMQYDIEHIYAKKRNEVEPLEEKWLLESLGNKSILEKRVNIRASDYRFADKKKIYLMDKHGTQVQELRDLAIRDDFTEEDIEQRNRQIQEAFLNAVVDAEIIKDDYAAD